MIEDVTLVEHIADWFVIAVKLGLFALALLIADQVRRRWWS